MRDHPSLTPELMLRAYMSGIFPMAESRDSPEVFWVDPERRGVIPLNNLHISRSLRRALRRGDYEIRINSDFEAVLYGCANRDETWINDEIHALYVSLFEAGYAHSMEVWQDNHLTGGIYGVTIGAAFFGESMFSARRNGSKIAMVYLVDRLVRGGFKLFDTQFITDHLASMGGIEISRAAYQKNLRQALNQRASFIAPPMPQDVQDVLQRNTHTS